MRTLFLLTTLLFIIPNMFGQKEYRLNSPDGKLEVTLYIGDRITYELTEEGHTLVAPSPLSVHLDNGTVWGNGSHLKRVSHRQANEVIPSPFYKRSEVKDVYNEMTLSFREHFNLIGIPVRSDRKQTVQSYKRRSRLQLQQGLQIDCSLCKRWR